MRDIARQREQRKQTVNFAVELSLEQKAKEATLQLPQVKLMHLSTRKYHLHLQSQLKVFKKREKYKQEAEVVGGT